MKSGKLSFKELPAKVRYGIVITISAWILFIISSILNTGTISILHMTMGMFFCFAILSLRKWSRIATSLYNIFMAIMIGFELYNTFSAGEFIFSIYTIVKIICIFMFSAASVFLFSRETAKFFTENS